MSGRKDVGRNWHTTKPTREAQEAIMFGKMCGCGKCRFCKAYEEEQVWEHMSDLVKAQTSEKAEAFRRELLKSMRGEPK